MTITTMWLDLIPSFEIDKTYQCPKDSVFIKLSKFRSFNKWRQKLCHRAIENKPPFITYTCDYANI